MGARVERRKQHAGFGLCSHLSLPSCFDFAVYKWALGADIKRQRAVYRLAGLEISNCRTPEEVTQISIITIASL